MFGQTRLAELQTRKELLILQASAHRQLLVLEAEDIEYSLHWLEPVYRGWQWVKPWAWLVAPVAGFFAARNFRSAWRWGNRLVKIGRWITGWL